MDDDIARTLAGRPNQWSGEGPVWCPVATMGVERLFGHQDTTETRAGTRHFAPGARLYLCHVMNYAHTRRGQDDMDLEVVGRHRATRRFVRLLVRASWLENWRVDLVYSPTVIRLLQPYWDGTAESKAEAASRVAGLKSFDRSATPSNS
jgi:hypothetical protein